MFGLICEVVGCDDPAMGDRAVPFIDAEGVEVVRMNLCKKHYFGPDKPYEEEN
jgi:hypothetical protein